MSLNLKDIHRRLNYNCCTWTTKVVGKVIVMASRATSYSCCCGCMVSSTEQCRRASSVNTDHASHSDVTVTSSGLDDVVYEAADVDDDDLDQSGSGDGGRRSRHWYRRDALSDDAVVPDTVTGRWSGRPTPLQLLQHRFRPAAISDADVAVATRRTAAATASSSSTSSQQSVTSLVTSFLLALQLALGWYLAILRTPCLVLLICD